MEKFYQWLLSTSWNERLHAYKMIEKDLQMRELWKLDEDEWEEMKLLVGQILSIHFKRYPARNVREFSERIKELYALLLNPLGKENSPGHCKSMKLLMDIYDDDDIAARQDIRSRFGRRSYDETRSVLENLFYCYQGMMQMVQKRLETVLA